MNKYKKTKTRVKKTKQTNKRSISKSIKPKKYITAKQKKQQQQYTYTKTFVLGPSKLNKRYAYAHFAHFAKFASLKELKGKG